ncbi:hypothetical protein LBMAG53_07000 [Planctomycetota bacterium]|nr:hypothetical protein LBMAG53_07000 [Planctomycetota bacterium]
MNQEYAIADQIAVSKTSWKNTDNRMPDGKSPWCGWLRPTLLLFLLIWPTLAAAESKTLNSARQLPPLLSQLGVFADLSSLRPAAAMVAYEVNSPLWSDGADKFRWFLLPPGGRIGYRAEGPWDFPIGTLFIKHFDLVSPDSRRRLETRVLVVEAPSTTAASIVGATYVWNAARTDAARVDATEVVTVPGRDGHQVAWGFPGRQDCAQCHTSLNGGVIGLTSAQLRRTVGGSDQIERLRDSGLFAASPTAAQLGAITPLADLHDAKASLDVRARSYLASNCSHCHLPGGTPAQFDVRFIRALSEAGLVNAIPVRPDAGMPLITPGRPELSLLYKRIASTTPGERMPPLASVVVDDQAIAVLREWITAMAPR